MKYLLLSVLCMPLVTACASVQDDYYAPYRSRAEAYRHSASRHYHRSQSDYRGAHSVTANRSAHGHSESVERGAVIATSNNAMRSNAHGHQRTTRGSVGSYHKHD